MRGEGRGSEKDTRTAYAHVQASDMSATVKLLQGGVLVWATHLSDAKPIPKAKVELITRDGRSLKRGVTDDDGVVKLSFNELTTKGTDELIVVVSEKGDSAVTPLSESTLSHAWQFGLPEQTGTPKLDAALFTERGVYRPGETVHVKAILSSAGPVQLRITDSRGQTVLDKKLEADALGGADTDLKLNEKAAVGGYVMRLTKNGRETTRSFQVQEYRVPTFEVKVTTGTESWTNGKHAVAVVDAKYFHGTPMAGRELEWTLYGEPETFQPANFPGFVFTPPITERTAELAQGESKLDGSGQAKLEFGATASIGPVRHVIEASVTDVDRQVFTGRLSRVVHPGDFYVGVRPPTRGVLSAKDIIEVPVIAVANDQTARTGVELDVVLEQLEYATSTRLIASRGTGWASSERDNVGATKEITRCHFVSTAQPQTCKLALPSPGAYRVMAKGRMGASSAKTSFTVNAAGDGVVAWPRFDRERIDVVADQKNYSVGDTAKLVVQTPFTSAQGLLTVEAGGVLTQRRFEISRDTPALEVPITEDMVPNAFVSVVLLRGRVHDEKDAAGYETGAPAFRLGYAKLDVDPASQRLAVKVEASEAAVKPGASVQLAVKVNDAKGAPAKGAVALMVVDEAVLGLTAHATPDPVKELYATRPLGVRTADGRLDLVHSRRSRQEALFPGGDGDSESFHRILTGDLRHLFQSTAYWNPNVVLGDDGTARVTVTLPDNLTTFRVMAVAFDGHGRAGSGDAKLIVRKALMVQPVLPRFIYPGDTLTVEALAFNGTSRPGELSVSAMSLEGLEAVPGAKLVQTNTVQGGASVKVGVPVKVTGRGKAQVRFRASLGKETDEVQVTVPILDAGAKRVVVVSKQVSASSAVLEVPLPSGRLAGSTEVELMVSSSSLSELKDSVDYLMGYPNGCIEQTTSTAYPLVVLKDLLPEMGVTVNEADLKKFSEAGVKRLLSFQTSSGGLAYWPGSDQPHIFGTTFGLTALIEGKKRGFAVPDEALNRAAAYLEKSLKQGAITEEMPHAAMPDGDTRALVVLTLNRLGRPQPSYVSTLWTERAKLSPFGIAMLAVAVSEGGGDKSLLDPMLASVAEAAKKEESQAWYDGERKGGWSMDSPLRTHAAALLAFGTGGQKSDMGPKLLTGLIKRKDGSGGWGNTQENVYGIMGIAKLAGRPGGDVPKAELTVGDKLLAMDSLEARSDVHHGARTVRGAAHRREPRRLRARLRGEAHLRDDGWQATRGEDHSSWERGARARFVAEQGGAQLRGGRRQAARGARAAQRFAGDDGEAGARRGDSDDGEGPRGAVLPGDARFAGGVLRRRAAAGRVPVGVPGASDHAGSLHPSARHRRGDVRAAGQWRHVDRRRGDPVKSNEVTKRGPLSLRERVGVRVQRLARLCALGAVALVGLEGWIHLNPYPRESLKEPPQSLRVLDRNGELLRESVNEEGERSRWVALEKVSPLLLQATLAAEDDRFRNHPGVDAKAIARAIIQDVTARRIVSGASTITMQLAKNLEPHQRRTVLGKLSEVINARRIELTLSKDEILEHYVNRVPYGAGSIGIEAASHRYFGKPASHLSLAEASMLAGLPKGPTGLNPLKNPDGAKARQQYVLDRLLVTGRASAEDVERARREPLTFASLELPSAMHFTEWVRQQGAIGTVRTTLDAELQREIAAMVTSHVATLTSQGVTNTAVVVLDNERCEVLSMVGSANYWDPRDGSVNGALAKRQPGSTLKPFTYALAWERGHSPASVAADIETKYGEVGGALYQPQNFSRDFSGPVLFHEALGRSLNIPAIRVAALFGAEDLLATLHAAGFASLDQPAEHYGLGLTLGNGEVTLLELAQGYAMFARGGATCRASLSLRSGERVGVRGEQIFSKETAFSVTAALSDEATRMRAFGPGNALMLPFPVAVKTGTSTNWRDNWAVGYTQKYTVAVWSGDFENRPLDQLAGASGAGPLFNRIMTRVALRGGQSRPVAFTPPEDVVETTVCATSGQKATPQCPERRRLFLATSQLPAHDCEHHQKLKLDHRNGLLAGATCPDQYVIERTFEVLPAQYAQWQAEHPRRAPPSKYSPLCPRTGPAAGAVVITWPRQGEVFLIEPGYSRSTQSLALTAEADQQAEVRWLMDGREVAKASITERPLWALAKGVHSIEAEVRGRRSAPVTFEVR